MILYYFITIWLFIVLLFGLRPDSIRIAENWPEPPEDNLAKINTFIVFSLVFASFLLLWFLTAFRSSAIGNDTKNYLRYFNLFSGGIDRSSGLEIGYQVLNYLISRVTLDQHAFLIIIASLMYGGVGVYFFKYSHNSAISLVLFYSFFFPAFACILRQGIAMVIALFGYQLLKNEKKLAASLLFLLATTFHTSAILCFLLFLDLKILKKSWFVLGLTALCAIISLTGVLKTVINALLPRYTRYFEGQYASSGWLAISFYLLSYIIFYFLVDKSLDENDKADKYVATNFTFLMILTAFGYAMNLFERAGEYFLLIAVVELPNMLYRGKVKSFRLWLFGICAVFLIVSVLILIYRPGWNHMYPYEFWH